MKKLLSWILILAMLLTSVFMIVACDDDDADNAGNGGNVSGDGSGSGNGGDGSGNGGDGSGNGGGGTTEQVMTREEVDTLLAATGSNMATMGDFHIVAAMNVKVAQGGATVEVPFNADIKISGLQSENPSFSFTATGNMMEESLNVGLYYKDGWLYMTEDGDGQKMQASPEDVLEMIGGALAIPGARPEVGGPMPAPEYSEPSGTPEAAPYAVRTATSEETDPSAMIEQLAASLFEDLMSKVTAVKLANGATEFRLNFTVAELVAKITAVLGDLVEQGLISEEELGEMIDAETLAGINQMASGSASIAVTVQNNCFTKFVFSTDLSLTVEGETGDIDATASIELVNPGQAVTVTLPEGAEDFENIGEPSIPADPDEAIAKLEAAGFEVTIGDPAEDSNYKSYTVIGRKTEGGSISQVSIVYCEDEESAETHYETFEAMFSYLEEMSGDLYMDGTIVWYTLGEVDVFSVFG